MAEAVDESSYLRKLLNLGQILNASLDPAKVLDTAIEQVIHFVGAERGFIILVEEGTRRVTRKVMRGIDPLTLESALSGRLTGDQREISTTICRKVFDERIPVISTNAMEDPRFTANTSIRLAHVRSVICVPLMAQNRMLGILYLDSRVKSGVFDEQHLEMLTAFATQAAVALENARLYENLNKSVEERLLLQSELHENEKRRFALEEASRQKSDYIGYVSHELRNPLTIIRGYIQTLRNEDEMGVDPALRREFYETIEVECDRMLMLISELLDSASLEANKPLSLSMREVDLKTLLEKMAKAQRYDRFWKTSHHIVMEINDNLPTMQADPDKLRQIMANLLSNAVKYSPEGGNIAVGAKPCDGGVLITVTDSGIGMSEESIGKLFGRYERLERDEISRIPGTGLGLFLTRRLVELHNGSISCKSDVGKGTTFTVFIPSRVGANQDEP